VTGALFSRDRWSPYEFSATAEPFPAGRVPPPGGYPDPVRLHVARFFDAQCSNEMCTLRIAHRETGAEFDPRQTLLTAADGHLNTLAESTLADCVGISTVAVTADGALLLVRQSIHNTASALLLAPSGSGSLDPRDLGHGSAATLREIGTLQDIVQRGMERELCEETGILPSEIRGTRVTGFARWLERGAKPEFFGITELSVTTDDLAGHRPLASGERRYTDGTLTMPVDIVALGRELAGRHRPARRPQLACSDQGRGIPAAASGPPGGSASGRGRLPGPFRTMKSVPVTSGTSSRGRRPPGPRP
jgi:hypothetical protein